MSGQPSAEDREAWRVKACWACRRFRPESCSCEAFPSGIPIGIASGQQDHFGPVPGDRGIRFERRPGPPADATRKDDHP